MPWCPNCKAEYVDGIKICNDCGTELVDELPPESEFMTFLETDKEKFAQKFVEFLQYSKIDRVTYEYDEEKKQWAVLIRKEQLKKVKKLYDAFYSVELDQELSKKEETSTETSVEDSSDDSGLGAEALDEEDSYTEAGEEEEDEYEEENDANSEFAEDPFEERQESMFDREELEEIAKSSQRRPVKSTVYVKKEEQYKDLKSTAATFLIVSLLGIAVLLLNGVGIIHIFYGWLPNVVMGALFLAFLFIGFQTLSSSKRVEKEIAQENSVTEAINTWLDENVTLELLDSLTNSADSEEIRFFHKQEKMKELINGQFGDLDDAYLDRLTEEYYNNHFEE